MSHFETDGKTSGRSCRSMNQQEAEKTNGFPGGENREQASIRVYHRCGGERTKPSKIPRAIFEAFQENDGEIAAAFGRSIDFLKKNRAEFK